MGVGMGAPKLGTLGPALLGWGRGRVWPAWYVSPLYCYCILCYHTKFGHSIGKP